MGNVGSTYSGRPNVVPEIQLESLSVVIPALNEEANIANAIQSVREHGLNYEPEIIVVDGESTDKTAVLAKQLGAKVITSERGRGTQLNAGWPKANGDWLLFLHADTKLPPGYGHMMEQEIGRPSTVPRIWGCFKGITTNVGGLSMSIIEWGVQTRTRLFHLPYGDQALFVKRSTIKSLNGFKSFPLLEDVDLVSRLKQISPPAIIPHCVHTSGRRWKKVGVWKTMLINQCVIVGWFLGVDARTLSNWYEGIGIRQNSNGKHV